MVPLDSLSKSYAVTIDWVTIGNPGNPADIHGDGLGGVDYDYRIGKYEVTNAQYTAFLNAVDPAGSNPLRLYNSNMSLAASGGIQLDGEAASGSKYDVKSGRDQNPVNFVSFFDAMRFVNWLENGQGSGSTETGVYTLGNGTDEVRNPAATYFLPSEDEWYKAAYHKNDGVTGNYWDYPTSSDTPPYSDRPNRINAPDKANVANFFHDDETANGFNDGYAVTGLPDFDTDEHYLTDVGAYSQTINPYGTFDQGGNVREFNEAVVGSLARRLRGGGWAATSGNLHAAHRELISTSAEAANVGFRIAASNPEPSTLLLSVIAYLGTLMRRQRKPKVC